DALAFTTYGKTLATLDEGELILWDTGTGQRRGGREWPRNPAGPGKLCVAFTPDGCSLLVANGTPAIRFCDPQSGEEEYIFDRPDGTAITALALSADGKYLAIAGADRPVLVWDLSENAQLGQVDGA